MNYEKIMTEIKSVREFKKQPVDSNLLSLIIKDAETMDNVDESVLKFSVIEDGEKFFELYDGQIGYFGKLIKAPRYILIFGKPEEKTKFKAGYITEWMRFKLQENELGSCWITAKKDTDYKAMFNLDEGETLLACLGIGYEYGGVFKKNIDKKAERKGLVDFVHDGTFGTHMTWEKLTQMAMAEVFYLSKFAPSWGNKQPWSFIVTDKEAYLVMEKSEESDMDLEAGIISVYFVKAAQSKVFTVKMQECEDKNEIKLPENQEIKLKFFF